MDNSFSTAVRVYYEDTDSGGVVYYANYLKFMERARTEWLRSRGFEQDTLRREPGILFVVVEVNVRYRIPARFNDLLDVSVRVVQRTATTMTFAQSIVLAGDPGRVLCEGEVRAACVDAGSFRPRPIPAEILPETL